MERAYYIVRVGNDGLARKITPSSTDHWHYLSAQHLWGFPKTMSLVHKRDQFESDIKNPTVTTYIWFLCNGHGGKGHFVQIGIGRRLISNGPRQDGPRTIPDDTMQRLHDEFDHWFDFEPLSTDEGFEDRVRQLPIPQPTYRATLRHVTNEHPSYPMFEDFINSERHSQHPIAPLLPPPQAQAPVIQVGPQAPSRLPTQTRTTSKSATLEEEEVDVQNHRREYSSPHGPGSIYLIHMSDSTFYKIGMSLDPHIRLSTLQTGNPNALVLLKTRTVTDMRTAEMGLHRLFDAYKVPNESVREWFDFTADRIGDVEKIFENV